MYDSEQLLVDDITKLISNSSQKIPNTFKKRNQVLLTEVSLGYGIADIVVTECEDIREIRDNYLTSTDIHILIFINLSSSLSSNDICTRTKCSKANVNNSVNKLLELNYVKEENNLLTTARAYKKTVKQAIAIEAKLKNWKRALKQAYRYKWFSERSFVCLPQSNIKPAIKQIDSFKQTNIGLIEMSPVDGMNIIFDPKPIPPISKDMSMLLNENVLSEINGCGEMMPRC